MMKDLGDIFYSNGRKKYDSFNKSFFYSNGATLYDGFTGNVYYEDGIKVTLLEFIKYCEGSH